MTRFRSKICLILLFKEDFVSGEGRFVRGENVQVARPTSATLMRDGRPTDEIVTLTPASKLYFLARQTREGSGDSVFDWVGEYTTIRVFTLPLGQLQRNA